MQRRIANDSAFADPILADLELRLDQRDEMRAGAARASDARQHGPQANEAGVAHDEADRLRNLCAGDVAHWSAPGLPRAHLAQFPGELDRADINGIDLGRAALQQQSVKPPVEAPTSSAVPPATDGEVIEGLRELEPAARNTRMRLAAQFERRSSAMAGRPCRAGARRKRRSRPGPGLRRRAAFGQAALDQRHIERDFARAPSDCRRRRAMLGRTRAPQSDRHAIRISIMASDAPEGVECACSPVAGPGHLAKQPIDLRRARLTLKAYGPRSTVDHPLAACARLFVPDRREVRALLMSRSVSIAPLLALARAVIRCARGRRVFRVQVPRGGERQARSSMSLLTST